MKLAPHPVTLRQLQYIVAVAERQSFRKAADACHVAQPSLSAQIAQAEEVLGVRLFDRDRRTVSVSLAGAAIVERARALLLAADELVEAARQFSDPLSGVLRLGVIPTVGPYLLPDAVRLLRERFPRLTFLWDEDRTSVVLSKLAHGDLDGVVIADVPEASALARVTLGKDPFLFAAALGHRLASARRAIRADELDGERVLLLDDGHCFRGQALSYCARAGAEEASFRATSLNTLAQMAASGIGVTILPSIAVSVENRRETLAIRAFAPKGPFRTLLLAFRPGSARETALRSVGAALQDAFRALTV